jgi:hypothetical protein
MPLGGGRGGTQRPGRLCGRLPGVQLRLGLAPPGVPGAVRAAQLLPGLPGAAQASGSLAPASRACSACQVARSAGIVATNG